MEPFVQILLASSADWQDKYLKAGLLDKCGGELIHLISAACAAVLGSIFAKIDKGWETGGGGLSEWP